MMFRKLLIASDQYRFSSDTITACFCPPIALLPTIISLESLLSSMWGEAKSVFGYEKFSSMHVCLDDDDNKGHSANRSRQLYNDCTDSYGDETPTGRFA